MSFTLCYQQISHLAGRFRTVKFVRHCTTLAMSEHHNTLDDLLTDVIRAVHRHHYYNHNVCPAIKKKLDVFMKSLPPTYPFDQQSAVLIWVLFTVSDTTADWYRRISFVSFPSELEWLRTVRHPNQYWMDPSAPQSKFESLPEELCTEIMHHLKRSDRGQASLTSKKLRHAVIASYKHSILAWALATFQTLGLQAHEIIDGLMKFRDQHPHLSRRIFKDFNSHAAQGYELRLEQYTGSLLPFIKLVDEQG